MFVSLWILSYFSSEIWYYVTSIINGYLNAPYTLKRNALAQHKKNNTTVCINLFWVMTTTNEIVFNEQCTLSYGN